MSSKLSLKFKAPAANMPALFHSRPGESFDIRQSEAARWLCSQPEIMQYVFDKARLNGLIEYSPETGLWKGAERRRR